MARRCVLKPALHGVLSSSPEIWRWCHLLAEQRPERTWLLWWPPPSLWWRCRHRSPEPRQLSARSQRQLWRLLTMVPPVQCQEGPSPLPNLAQVASVLLCFSCSFLPTFCDQKGRVQTTNRNAFLYSLCKCLKVHFIKNSNKSILFVQKKSQDAFGWQLSWPQLHHRTFAKLNVIWEAPVCYPSGAFQELTTLGTRGLSRGLPLVKFGPHWVQDITPARKLSWTLFQVTGPGALVSPRARAAPVQCRPPWHEE